MKKLFVYITIFALLFVSVGCGRDETPSPPATTLQTTLPTETTTVPETEPPVTEPPIEIPQQPMTAVYLPAETDSTKADDGTVVFLHAKQGMVLTAEDPDVADRILMDFLNRTNSHSGTEKLAQTAKQMHANGATGLPLWVQSVYTPQRVDRSILSLYGYESTYEGGAHGSTSYQAVTYDFLTGHVLSLQNILAENVTSADLCGKVTKALESQVASLFPDYQTLVADLFQRPVSEYTDWYLSAEGLCFYFSPYEIAPYASGDIVATIPYSELIGALHDAYFPAERDVARGALIQSTFDPDALSQFTQIAEVSLSESGKKVVLHTDYSIHDMRINQKVPSIGNAEYEESVTVFAAAGLTREDAIVIQIPDGAQVTVTYNANGQTFTETI